MSIRNLVFSDRTGPRIARHLLFWICYGIDRMIDYAPVGQFYSNWRDVRVVLEDGLVYLPVLACFVYTGLYVILPKYLAHGRYRAGLTVTAFVFLIVVLTAMLVSWYALSKIFDSTPTALEIIREGGVFSISVFLPFFVSAMAIKITKHHIIREKENQQLLQQKLDARLRLMKAKLQPAVLLDALADIHADITGSYQHAPEMILALSDLLHYILYETTTTRVDLAREIKMTQDFMRFKSGPRNQQATMEFAISGNPQGKTIPPLLCLPLIDMLFRGNSVSDQPFRISVSWLMHGEITSLSMVSTQRRAKGFISRFETSALDATRTNLETHYPGKFSLEVEEGEEKLDIFMEFSVSSKPVHEYA